MSEFTTLEEVATKLKDDNKKVTLLYAFNATGKTRLSMIFKELLNRNHPDDEDESEKRVLYFNAFTEDLFYWENDIINDSERKLKMNTNSRFIELINNQGKENEIKDRFQQYTLSKIEPDFKREDGEIAFNLATGDTDNVQNIKISRGEESTFIWSIFYTLMETVVVELSIEKEQRSTDQFNALQYIFIDDPISSLDDNHAISVALDLARLIKSPDSEKNNLKFIITTHHALFFNVLHNELKMKKKVSRYILEKNGINYELKNQNIDSPFGAHLSVKKELERAIKLNELEKYHFNLLRNLLEKTATFLGYDHWRDCIQGENITEEDKKGYERIINLYSHNSHSAYEYKEPTIYEKRLLINVFQNFIQNFKWKEEN